MTTMALDDLQGSLEAHEQRLDGRSTTVVEQALKAHVTVKKEKDEPVYNGESHQRRGRGGRNFRPGQRQGEETIQIKIVTSQAYSVTSARNMVIINVCVSLISSAIIARNMVTIVENVEPGDQIIETIIPKLQKTVHIIQKHY